MTNGEMIQKMFPCINFGTLSDDDVICNRDYSCNEEPQFFFNKWWWNAEYKEPTNKIDCDNTDCNNCVNHKYCDYEPTTKNGISNRTIIYKVKESKEIQEDLDKLSKLNEPTTKSETLVSLDVYNQVAKERDIAIQQLHELGYEFGQKIEPTTKNDLGVDYISRQEVLRLLASSIGKSNTYLQTEVLRMSSVTPQEPMVIPIAEVKFDKDKLKELVDRAVLTVIPQEPRWIPVSERLPEKNGNYLVTCNSSDGSQSIQFQIVDHYGPDWLHQTKNRKVLAWMPLPDPYSEVEE